MSSSKASQFCSWNLLCKIQFWSPISNIPYYMQVQNHANCLKHQWITTSVYELFDSGLVVQACSGEGKGFLFNVGSQRKSERLSPADHTAGVFYLPSTQSRLVLQEKVLNEVLSPRTRCQSETQPQPGSNPDRLLITELLNLLLRDLLLRRWSLTSRTISLVRDSRIDEICL